jgi:hypothetical protein
MISIGSSWMVVCFLAVIASMAPQQLVNGQYEHIQSPFYDNDKYRLTSIVLPGNTNVPVGAPYTTVFTPTSNCECDMSINVANNMYSHMKITDMINTKLTREVTSYDLTTGSETTALKSYDMSSLDVTMTPLITTTIAADQPSSVVENAIAQVLPTVDKIVMEGGDDMKMTAVFEGHSGGAMIFEREY